MIKMILKLFLLAILLFGIAAFALRIFKDADATPKFIFVLLYVVIVFLATTYKYIMVAERQQ